MDLQYYGGNCVVATLRGMRIVVDDSLAEIGQTGVIKKDDVVLFTNTHPEVTARIVCDQPGEYEVSDVSIVGTAARAHMDEENKKTATMFKVRAGDLSLLFTGHIYPELSNEQMERIGMVDVMFVPVGGNGYTLDPVGALKLIKAIEPKVVIPTHYDDKKLHYPVTQQPLEEAIKTFGMEVALRTDKLKLKASDLTDVTQLMVLERS